MKILHLADLHLGKTLNQHSLLEDQEDWIEKVLVLIGSEKPDAVVIAGDVYDRSVPSREAVPLLSGFLTRISAMGIPVLLAAGNHDGGERLEFASELLCSSNVYIAGTVKKEIMHVTQDCGDGYGPVTFWLLPYAFPSLIREVLGITEEDAPDYTSCMKKLLEAQDIDYTQRNVLVAHQTVLDHGREPAGDGSETAIAGIGGIEASVFDGFDYVALGHIHGAQKVGRECVRYAGSPLCYHFSEAVQKKGPLFVTLGAKGEPAEIRTETLEPLHRVRPTMRGKLEEIIEREKDDPARNEYVQVILTDRIGELPQNAEERLQDLFKARGCMLLETLRDPEAFSAVLSTPGAAELREQSLETTFCRFYREKNQSDPAGKDADLIAWLADRIVNLGEETPEELAQKLTDYAVKQEEKA